MKVQMLCWMPLLPCVCALRDAGPRWSLGNAFLLLRNKHQLLGSSLSLNDLELIYIGSWYIDVVVI